MQGGYLSALPFIFYLKKCLWEYRKYLHESILIASKYTDGITYALKNEEIKRTFRNEISGTLDVEGLLLKQK